VWNAFSLFYFTYPKDAAKVGALMLERREELLKARREASPAD
jgi:hypothetical protein